MSDLCLFTTGSNLDLFNESCARFGIVPCIYECGWTDYVDVKLVKGIEFLKTQTQQYAMWLDGNDSLVLANEETIIERFLDLTRNGEVLISAERSCWPDSELADRYPVGVEPRFINAGGFIGHRSTVIETMEIVLKHATGGDDQRAWVTAYLAGAIPWLRIDHGRRIFASVGDGEVALRSDSCSRHWNGRSPGRSEYWKAIYG